MHCPELGADLTCELLARISGKKSNPFDGAVETFFESAMSET